MSRRKIICPFCKERFDSIQRFYAHVRVCEKERNGNIKSQKKRIKEKVENLSK